MKADRYVLDTSAILALMFGEPGAEAVLSATSGAAVSTINYAELVTVYVRKGLSAEKAQQTVEGLQLELIPFSAAIAHTTGILITHTHPFGLSLGDRACLATAKHLTLPVLTADKSWSTLDVGVKITIIR